MSDTASTYTDCLKYLKKENKKIKRSESDQ